MRGGGRVSPDVTGIATVGKPVLSKSGEFEPRSRFYPARSTALITAAAALRPASRPKTAPLVRPVEPG